MPKIIPNLWFDNQAAEAAEFYVSVFPNSRVTATSHYTDAGPGEPGSVLTVAYELDGEPFIAINGGPAHAGFTETVSFLIECEDQAEIDAYWAKLTADGGSEQPCGWCKDKFGLSWQVVPKGMDEFFASNDTAAVNRAMEAMFTMTKLDVAALEAAAKGTGAPAA
ncbi:VOC family protein [Baekduia sp. Peel2402]|uniref:VOC family protein n=1 Tax=Baekduia sp. Peel2402 TaxID=3458296 RepID=UPI00403EAA0B